MISLIQRASCSEGAKERGGRAPEAHIEGTRSRGGGGDGDRDDCCCCCCCCPAPAAGDAAAGVVPDAAASVRACVAAVVEGGRDGTPVPLLEANTETDDDAEDDAEEEEEEEEEEAEAVLLLGGGGTLSHSVSAGAVICKQSLKYFLPLATRTAGPRDRWYMGEAGEKRKERPGVALAPPPAPAPEAEEEAATVTDTGVCISTPSVVLLSK